MSTLGSPPNLAGGYWADMSKNMEYAHPGTNQWALDAWEEIQQLRTCLIRIAEIAGEDGEAVESARTGALVHPPLTEFAFQAVLRLQFDYRDLIDGGYDRA